MKRSLYLIMSVLLLVSLAGCPPNQQGLKSISDMTPKEKAVFFMSVYSSQAEDYKMMVTRIDLSDEQKNILKKKKKLLTEVYPLIGVYVGFVDAGALPTPEVEASIMNLINQLTATAVNL